MSLSLLATQVLSVHLNVEVWDLFLFSSSSLFTVAVRWSCWAAVILESVASLPTSRLHLCQVRSLRYLQRLSIKL